MASTKIKKNDADKLLQLVSFKIGEEEFGVDILSVHEIIRMLQVTKIPNSPSFVEGVINLRGKVIPVVDLRSRLRMDKVEHNQQTRIIVVEINERTIGFIVDEVKEVLRIPENITEPPPDMVSGIDAEYITAVGKLDDRLLILLDLEKVFSLDEIENLKEMKA
ncbi:MAG: chemotaxis protein CheW [Melioribacteraceae bacterium]|nr:chemotaxis protein CheW [Melioribacteraceae bacterium]MCF8355173.1 chemotaxis protein CheW [Melioribacteraceae bacterium]MCF8392502.1 chemotaxis protein CheW [Melioribacteraceae bacterium]MCF8418413.1 chemotaxis protein CheW [Melioribacteraceae bacterium]